MGIKRFTSNMSFERRLVGGSGLAGLVACLALIVYVCITDYHFIEQSFFLHWSGFVFLGINVVAVTALSCGFGVVLILFFGDRGEKQ